MDLVEKTREIVGLLRKGGYDVGSRLMQEWLDGFQACLARAMQGSTNTESLMQAARDLLQAQEHGDFVLMADILEFRLIPILSEIK